MNQSIKTCGVPGCEKPFRARDLCSAHYKRRSEQGVEGLDAPLRRYNPGVECSVSGCEKVHKSLGFCSSHAARFQRHGDPLGGIQRHMVPVPCSENGCESRARTIGLCHKHATRKRKREMAGFVGRTCARCHSEIDFGEVPATGRARRSVARLCGSCRKPNVAWRWERLRARDGDSCHLCGEVIDFALTRPDMMAKSVDHIRPVALGGSDDDGNLALAHLRCNVFRQTMPVEEARALLRSKKKI